MANVNDTDTFLVNRSNSSYQLQAQNLMAELLDDDLMLVNRNGKSYKATGAEIKGSLKPPAEVIKPQILAPADGAGSTVAPETDVIIDVVAPDGPVTYEGRGSNYSASTPNWNLSEATPIPLNNTTPVTLQTWAAVAATSYTNNVGDQPPQAGGSGTSYQIHYFKLDSAGVVSFVRYPSAIPTDMYLIFYSDDGNTWNYDETATQLSASKGIVMYPDISVRGTDDHLYWAISRINIAQFNANSNSASCTATAAYNYGVGDAVNHTELTLDGEKSLDVLQVGDLIKQDDDAANGVIDEIIKAGNASKIKVMPSYGTWSANTGNYVVGPEVTDPNAPDPSGVNFVGSNFASSDGSLIAGSADWQVAAKADTTYSNPVSQVTGHPEMGPPPKWTSGALEDETEYRARTKYYAASGEESAWSDDVTFKTAKANDNLGTPSDWIWNTSGSKISDKKLVNAFTGNFFFGAVAVDGTIAFKKVDGANDELTNWQSDPNGEPIVSAASGYNRGFAYLTSSGKLYEYKNGRTNSQVGIDQTPLTEFVLLDTDVKMITQGCAVTDSFVYLKNDGALILHDCVHESHKYPASLTGGEWTVAANNPYTSIEITPVIPNGSKIKSVCGTTPAIKGQGYTSGGYVALTEDGQVYSWGYSERKTDGTNASVESGGTRSNPLNNTPTGETIKKLGMANGAARYQGIFCIANSGKLYGYYVSLDAPTGFPLTPYATPFELIDDSHTYVSVATNYLAVSTSQMGALYRKTVENGTELAFNGNQTWTTLDASDTSAQDRFGSYSVNSALYAGIEGNILVPVSDDYTP